MPIQDKLQIGSIHSGRNRIVRRIFETGLRRAGLDRVMYALP